MKEEKDFLYTIEREPWKIEGTAVLWDIKAYCYAERQIVGPYYLLRSECRDCPLNNICKNVSERGWLFLDNLPDCDHDMCCFEGCSIRDVHVLENKMTGQTALSGNYHESYDFCRFIMGLPEEFDQYSQEDWTAEQVEMFETAAVDVWRLRIAKTETEKFSIDTVALSCLEELPDDMVKAFDMVQQNYEKLTASLPVPYTVEDYLPSRKMNFLKMYNVRTAKSLSEFVKFKRRDIVLKEKYGDDQEKLWEKMRPYYDEDKKTIDEFYRTLPIFGQELVRIFRRLYPKTLDASLLVDSNHDYVWTKRIQTVADEFEKAQRKYSEKQEYKELRLYMEPVLRKMVRLSGQILSFYSK